MLIWLCFSFHVWADTKQKITLHDGSVIVGELTNFDGQFYTFSTGVLGEIKLPVSDVQSLHTIDETELLNSKESTRHSSHNISEQRGFSPQTVQEPQKTNSPREPRSAREPASPDTNYQNNSSQTPNTSLIYGMNNSVNQETITGMQNMMMSDNQMMGLIVGLQNDPDLAKILNNPQLMLYMSTGNIEELQKSPELEKLMSKPEVQQLMQMMQK